MLKLADYCLVSDVKVVLHIDEEETSEDSELASCVSVGCGLVDGFLKPKDLVVPQVVPLLVVQAAPICRVGLPSSQGSGEGSGSLGCRCNVS